MIPARFIAVVFLLLSFGCEKTETTRRPFNPKDVTIEEINDNPARAEVAAAEVKKRFQRILERGKDEERKNRLITRICRNAGGCERPSFRGATSGS